MATITAPPTTKGWTVDGLVQLGPRMEHIPRVSAVRDGERLGEIIKNYEASGTPLIIEDWHKTPCWPGDKLFGIDWVLEHGDEMIAVRDCVSLRDKEISLKDFIEKSRTISEYAEEGERERLYGKDAVCPQQWHEWLMDSAIPEVLKPGSSEDVLELLPGPERVETLMCYYGIGDTFTAAHKDLCASSGQNLMCSTERGGSAFWFMTRSSDAAKAAAYFQRLGSELDHEEHVATPMEFSKAPFTVYVAEQRIGDLVLVPRRSCHQVVNHGGVTAKMSWSRMTVEGLVTAFHHELPIYRRVCRCETYRVKLLIYRTLLKYSQDLKKIQQGLQSVANSTSKASGGLKLTRSSSESPIIFGSPLTPLSSEDEDEDDSDDTNAALTPEHQRLVRDVRSLVSVYDKILKEEHNGHAECEVRDSNSPREGRTINDSASVSNKLVAPDIDPASMYHDGLTCDFCGADIFQSFFECRSCARHNAQEDAIIVCPSCYAEGRSCSCTIMNPMQQFPMDMLLEVRNEAAKLLNVKGYRKKDHPDFATVRLSYETIDSFVDHPAIFSAACQLLQTRKTMLRRMQANHSCRAYSRSIHLVPAGAALNCRKCHCSHCFKHMLQQNGCYAADAINLQASTPEGIHAFHMTGDARLTAARPAVLKAQETGEPCDMSASLVLHARQYTSCRPMNGNVREGWYDDTHALPGGRRDWWEK